LWAVVTLGAVALVPGAAAAPAAPHVTVIGDSVLTAVQWNVAPLATLQQGFAMELDIGVCRRIVVASCPFEGGRVPTVMDAIAATGVRLGPTVLVEVGYNDDARTFEHEVEGAVQAMLRFGVQRILWVNFPAANPEWVEMNAALEAVAARHHELTVVDWNGPSHEHWSWFQGDGIHLLYPGAMALASILNQALVQATAVPALPRVLADTLPPAVVGQSYTAHLVADRGTAPYRWRSASGPLPRGLRLLADGTITGVPARPGRAVVVFQVTDARGEVATVRATLVVAASPSATGANRVPAKPTGKHG
jgi:hypothetical protein